MRSAMFVVPCVLFASALTLGSDAKSKVKYTCTSDSLPSYDLLVEAPLSPSVVGEVIHLSLRNKTSGIVYWRIPMHATVIEDDTVTYESNKGALVDRHTDKPEGKQFLLIRWVEEGNPNFSLQTAFRKNPTNTEGKCSSQGSVVQNTDIEQKPSSKPTESAYFWRLTTKGAEPVHYAPDCKTRECREVFMYCPTGSWGVGCIGYAEWETLGKPPGAP